MFLLLACGTDADTDRAETKRATGRSEERAAVPETNVQVESTPTDRPGNQVHGAPEPTENGDSRMEKVKFISVSAGGEHTCGLRTNGSVDCWGWGKFGQLAVPEEEFISIESGALHNCGMKRDGSVVCWGRTSQGVSASPPGEFVSFSSGGQHNCAVKADGEVLCWGNGYHRLDTPPGEKFVSVSAAKHYIGDRYSCGVLTDNTLSCWTSGYNLQQRRQAAGREIQFHRRGRGVCLRHENGWLRGVLDNC